LQVKKEVESTEEEDTVENESSGNDSKIDPTNHASTTAPERPENLKNQCEKCPKSFASITLLRYHYCSHFRTVLKKRFANMYNDDKCLVCAKTFPNPGRLLLHIGINHDKINEILKSKGITELPSYSSGAQDGMEPPHEPETDEAANDDDANVATANPSLTKDIKNIPLLGAQSANPVGGAITSASVLEPSNSNSIITSTSSATTTQIPTVAVTKAPSSAPIETNSSFDKNDPTSECNYDLECQVCDQKLKTISLLEQHCCRHFMKELQDHYSSLMDGLKCNVCYSHFKQKHSLLLHIGCKHGKINDILRKKGYAALPCPVTTNTSAAMQKQLVQVKKERLELADENPDDNQMKIRKKIEEGESLAESSLKVGNDTPVSGTSLPPTLDDILKKYKFIPGSK